MVHSGTEESSSVSDHSNAEEDDAADGKDVGADKHGTKTISNDTVASDGEEEPEPPTTQDTLTNVSQVFSTHEDSDSESDTGEQVWPKQKKWAPKTPKEDDPLKELSDLSSDDKPPTDEALCDKSDRRHGP